MRKRNKKGQVWNAAIYGGLVLFIVGGLLLSIGQDILTTTGNQLDSNTRYNNFTFTGTTTSTQLYQPNASGGSTGVKGECLSQTSGEFIITNETAVDGINILGSGNYTIEYREGKVALTSTSEYLGDTLNITFFQHNRAWCNTYDAEVGNANISSYFGLLGTIIIMTGIIVALTVLIIRRFM